MTVPRDVILRAERDLGYTEQPPGSNCTIHNDWYYGRRECGPWCATALSQWFFESGLPLPASTAKGFAYTPSGAEGFRSRRLGEWLSPWSPIRVGDVAFFWWPSVGRIAHVGIVRRMLSRDRWESIEGNTDESGGRTGGKVMIQVRSRATVGSRGGFGRPRYDERGDMANYPITPGLAILTPTGRGMWGANQKGELYTSGDAAYFGAVAERAEWLAGGRTVVGLQPTKDGYAFLISDGGIRRFGPGGYVP